MVKRRWYKIFQDDQDIILADEKSYMHMHSMYYTTAHDESSSACLNILHKNVICWYHRNTVIELMWLHGLRYDRYRFDAVITGI